jgi:hypothetical protein
LRFRKGSKQIRRVFELGVSSKIKVRNLARVTTFFRLIGSPKPEEEVCALLAKEWNTQCYPVKLREFIYKFRSNILGLNTRVSHFNLDVTRACTFCELMLRDGGAAVAVPVPAPLPVPGPVPVPVGVPRPPPIPHIPIAGNNLPLPDESFLHIFLNVTKQKKQLKALLTSMW